MPLPGSRDQLPRITGIPRYSGIGNPMPTKGRSTQIMAIWLLGPYLGRPAAAPRLNSYHVNAHWDWHTSWHLHLIRTLIPAPTMLVLAGYPRTAPLPVPHRGAAHNSRDKPRRAIHGDLSVETCAVPLHEWRMGHCFTQRKIPLSGAGRRKVTVNGLGLSRKIVQASPKVTASPSIAVTMEFTTTPPSSA